MPDLGAADGPGARVEVQVTGRQHRRPRPGAAAQQRAQPGREHHVGEGLGHVVVSAEIEPVGLVVLAVLGGQDEHRHPVPFGPEPLAYLVAGQAGQHQVEHHGVVLALPGQVQAVHAVMGDVDDEPLGGQAAAHRRGEPPFVFYHEHPHRPSLTH